MVFPSLFTEYPLGRFVCDTESPKRHTKNGVNCSFSLADNTSAKIESLLRSNETDAPHKHMWDTESYRVLNALPSLTNRTIAPSSLTSIPNEGISCPLT